MTSPATLKDYIASHSQNGVELAFLFAGAGNIAGPVDDFGSDYVVVRDKNSTPRVVPFSAIAWVTPL
jgi:hypothetical protein